MRQRRALRGLAVLLGLALVAAACGDDDDSSTSDTTEADGGGAAASDFKGCQVTDTGGVDDRSFNQTAYKGLQDAADQLGFEPAVLESQAESDYAPNIQSFLDQGCDLIVTVGFLLGGATADAALANPDRNFAIVDYDFSVAGGDAQDEFDNIKELTFSTDQAAFLAGYVAAAMSETGTVGTYGGINIPTVTIFMKGFQLGIEKYNEDNNADVKLIGWDNDADDGLFTGDFEDQAKGRATTESLLDQGADIIMPVAGPVGQGTIEAIRARPDSNARVVWVDTDGCVSVPDDCDLFLTSVMKNMDVAVRDVTVDAAEGNFQGGLYVGTLENDGVALGPFNDFEDQVPDEVKSAVDDLRQQIIDGDITTTPDG
ncbi:MAG TPA: BMP family ABC transporter substrate-binding protein [Acidimicrobiales bacterium]|nr:BMP family ABC transporter substrate-binding protein [Acidimicrobiales bacterium]